MQIAVVLLILAVFIVLIGIGIALALTTIACIAGLIAVGVLSSSVLVAITQRNAASGVSFFLMATTALIGGFAGLAIAAVIAAYFQLHLTSAQALTAGFSTGAISGLAIGAMLHWIFLRAMIYLRRIAEARRVPASTAPR